MIPGVGAKTQQPSQKGAVALGGAGVRPGWLEAELVATFLHKLSQPLAALRLSLELALLRCETPEQYGERIKEALEQADRMVNYSRDLRELAEVSSQRKGSEVVDFGEMARAVLDFLAPVSASRGLQSSVSCDKSLMVRASPDHLKGALLRIIEEAFLQCEEGSTAAITVSQEETSARLAIRGRVHTPTDRMEGTLDFAEKRAEAWEADEPSDWNWEMAKRMIEADGGTLDRRVGPFGECQWVAELPVLPRSGESL